MRCMVLTLNHSMYGGSDLWGTQKSKEFEAQHIGDQLIEVVGIYGYVAVIMPCGLCVMILSDRSTWLRSRATCVNRPSALPRGRSSRSGRFFPVDACLLAVDCDKEALSHASRRRAMDAERVLHHRRSCRPGHHAAQGGGSVVCGRVGLTHHPRRLRNQRDSSRANCKNT